MHDVCRLHVGDRPTHLIEHETMVMGRHVHMGARSSREIGGLERGAYILPSRLQMQGPMTIAQLSEAFGLDAATLNRQTAALRRCAQRRSGSSIC